MAKIETIKTELVEFKVFAASKVYLLFEKTFKKSLIEHIQANPHDVNAYAHILHLGHKSWAKLAEEKEIISDPDYILDRLDLNEMASGVMRMLGLNAEKTTEKSDKKK